MPESEEERKKAGEEGHKHTGHTETAEEKRKREEDARKREEKK